MKVLVASPHPDDDLIGCGGSMIRHCRDGHDLTVVYMTSGNAGSLTLDKMALAAQREGEAREALALVGSVESIFLSNDDGYLAFDRDNLVCLMEIIRQRQPDLLYIPHRQEAHADHEATHRLWVEALRRARGPWFQEAPGTPWSVPAVLCYEVWTPLTEVSHMQDITAEMPLKLEALRCHRSQLRDVPYDEAVECLNRYRGITTGCGRYGECFQVFYMERMIPPRFDRVAAG